MPKEITHWTIAEESRNQLEQMDDLKRIIDNHIHLYYIGAVVLDTPFYCLWGSKKQELLKAAQHIHNHAGNGLLPVQRLLDHQGMQLPEATWALILGMITHVWADAIFHPLINYFSGDKKNPQNRKKAKYRHHYLETMLDLHFIDQVELINHLHFKISYANKELDEAAFLRALMIVFWNGPTIQDKILKKALSFHSAVQKSFTKKWPLRILQFLNWIPGVSLLPSIALFYPRITPIHLPFFNQSLSFRHPFSGEEIETSIARLKAGCITNIQATFKLVNKYLTSEKTGQPLQLHVAPNLNTGIIHSLAEDMRYFDTSREIKELVSGGQ
jgi:hypothetical protein